MRTCVSFLKTASVVALALAFWLMTPSAFAHAVIERSEPRANASLPRPPSRLVVVFNEPVNPAFSSVLVFDAEGRQAGKAGLLSGNGRQAVVELGTLPPGVYTAKWRVLSAIDGHTTSGFFAFGVGQAVPPGQATQAIAAPGPIRFAVRWIGFLAALLVVGIAFFPVTVLRPALAGVNRRDALGIGQAIVDRLRALTAITALVLLVSVTAEFTLQSTDLLDVSLRDAVASGRLWPLLGGTKPGWSVLVRVGTAIILLASSASFGRIPRLGMAQFAWVSPLAGAGLLAGITIASHASGKGTLAVVADWAHLLAVALWIGGLPCLLLALRVAPKFHGQHLSRVLVPRFSVLAGISLGTAIVTGLYGAWLHLPSLRALTGTPYGSTLLIKLGLVVLLVVLGALNRFVLRPRIVAATGRSLPQVLRQFLRSVTGEVGVGAMVLLAVAVLTITPPAKVTVPAAPQKALILAGLAEDARVQLTIAPARPGWNRFEVVVADRDGRPVASEARVFLRLTKLDEDLDPKTVMLVQEGDGQYVVEGGDLGLPGWWEIEVLVRQRGRQDVSTTFPLHLGVLSMQPPERAAVSLLEGMKQAMAQVGAWRQAEQITDGAGNVLVTNYEMKRPDRLRYRTTSGNEGVIIGTDRYLRVDGGMWQKETLSSPFTVTGPGFYAIGAAGARLGRKESCGAETCRVVTWETPARAATFAGWVGLTSRRVHRLLMSAPSHYMTAHFWDFGVPLEVERPRQTP